MIRYMCCQSEHSKNYLTAEFIFSESLLPKEDLSSRLLRCVVATEGCLFSLKMFLPLESEPTAGTEPCMASFVGGRRR